jgi:hypothetical protein
MSLTMLRAFSEDGLDLFDSARTGSHHRLDLVAGFQDDGVDGACRLGRRDDGLRDIAFQIDHLTSDYAECVATFLNEIRELDHVAAFESLAGRHSWRGVAPGADLNERASDNPIGLDGADRISPHQMMQILAEPHPYPELLRRQRRHVDLQNLARVEAGDTHRRPDLQA